MKEEKPYNPLDKRSLGESVAEALLCRDYLPLDSLEPFQGAGIYALYYFGDFPAYREIAKAPDGDEPQCPIYVGKAVPAGSRKGGQGLETHHGQVLYKRLREHAGSIKLAKNLDVNHFKIRYLIVDEIWIPLGESILIAMFQPIWNLVIDGFGNHTPGSNRQGQVKSPWDVLHPGREWAEKCKPSPKNREVLLREIADFLSKNRTKKS